MLIMWSSIGCSAFIALGVIFLAGYLIAHAMLDAIAKRGIRRLSKWRHVLTEQNIDKFAIIGGVFSLVIVPLLILEILGEPVPDVLIVLIIVGVTLGFLTFFLIGEPTTKASPKATIGPSIWPPRSTKVPPARANVSGSTTSINAPPSAPQAYYHELLVKARHDVDLVDRLIDYERKHTPHASFDELCRNAIARWERDSR